MGCVKFTSVKLINIYFTLICFFLLFSTENSVAEEHYFVQISASTTQLNISDLAQKHHLTDSIIEVRSEFWYRYIIGSFESYSLALEYATSLNEKNGFKNAFVRVLDIDIKNNLNPTQDLIVPIENKNENETETVVEADTIQKSAAAIKTEVVQDEEQSDKKNKNIGGNSFFNIFLSEEKISKLKKDLIEYGNLHLPANIRSLYFLVIEKSFEYSIILIFVGLILFFVANIIFVLVLLDYTIKRKSHKKKFEKIFTKMYEEVLLAYMFGNINWELAQIKLKRKSKRANRKILISILLNLKANFKGEMEHFIPEIYTKLSLHHDSLKSAKSNSNYKRARGIMELTNLYPEGAKGIINKSINDPNDFVSSEAQTAFIRLNQEAPFNFFHTLEKPFTRWTQLSAFNLIRLHQIPVPSFAQFLHYKHPNIRNFSLIMITYFQQLENVSDIIRMVESKMERTRFLSYKAINNLRIYDSREILKTKFWVETENNKLEIIKAFRNIGLPEDFEFLEQIMISESMSLKTEACRSMYFMNQEGKDKLKHINSDLIPEIEILIAHVTDPRN